MNRADFWNDQEKAKEIIQELKTLNAVLKPFEELGRQADDLEASLELAEEGTRVADAAGGVSDEVWAHAAKHYDDEQLTTLVILVSFMNSVNRLNIITRQPCAGDYEPGLFG